MPDDNLYPSATGTPQAPDLTPVPGQDQPGAVSSPAPPPVEGDAAVPPAPRPADAAGYKAELPADLKLPDGVNFSVSADDPLLGEARAWAHENGLTQAQFSGLLALRAKMDVAAHEAMNAHFRGELKALGDKAQDRIAGATTFLRSKLPADQFEALKGAVTSAKAVEAIETLMQSASGPVLPGSVSRPPVSGGDTLSTLYPSMYPSMKKAS